MKIAQIISLLIISYIPILSAHAQNAEKMLGTYTAPRSANPLHSFTLLKDKNTSDLKVQISAWGFPDDTDWGEAAAEIYELEDGNSARIFAHYKLKDKKITIFAQPWNGGISVQCFTDQAGKPNRYFEQQLTKSK